MSSLSVQSLSNNSQTPPDLLFVGFNQDEGCFACGTTKGFSIYNCEPYKETFKRDFPKNGGIGIVAMLYRCNILGLVGGGKHPCFPPNKVMLWDDHQAACIGELTFKSDVKAVKLRRDKIVVVLETQVYVYNFDKLELVHKYETVSNPKGLCALSPSTDNCVLACPSIQKGVVRVERLDLQNQKKNLFITAHDSSLSCISLNLDGSLLATASEKGTLIRIFDTETGDKLQEVRRGADRAEIYSIAFSHNSQLIAVSSDKGTIHIFSISGKSDSQSEEAIANRKSKMSVLGSVLPSYFNSEWSFAWFRAPECPSICAFGQDDSVIVVSANGTFLKIAYDPKKGGECRQVLKAQYFKSS
eukprot:GEZU01042607.1.p1 GENE.GEZU01042607.1~~GEZU01042607.1.p1  ORF type:complete len:357 (+),score=81.98 GEZU01042607.1:142-1212(+)